MGTSASGSVFFGTTVEEESEFDYKIEEQLKELDMNYHESSCSSDYKDLLLFRLTGKKPDDFIDMSYYDDYKEKYIGYNDMTPKTGYVKEYDKHSKYWFNKTEEEYNKNHEEYCTWKDWKEKELKKLPDINMGRSGSDEYTLSFFYVKNFNISAEWGEFSRIDINKFKVTPEMVKDIHNYMQLLGFEKDDYLEPSWYLTSYYG